jgi:hypothetical protein
MRGAELIADEDETRHDRQRGGPQKDSEEFGVALVGSRR